MESKQVKFKKLAKRRLLDADKTVAEVARQIGYPRTTVSQAIHHSRFPRVVEKLKEALAI